MGSSVSLLVPPEGEEPLELSAAAQASLAPVVDVLAAHVGIEVVASPIEILVEFVDSGQSESIGRVFIRAHAEGRPCETTYLQVKGIGEE